MAIKGSGTFGIGIDVKKSTFNLFHREMDKVDGRVEKTIGKYKKLLKLSDTPKFLGGSYAAMVKDLASVNDQLDRQYGALGRTIKNNQKAKMVMEQYGRAAAKVQQKLLSRDINTLSKKELQLYEAVEQAQQGLAGRATQISNQHAGVFKKVSDNAKKSTQSFDRLGESSKKNFDAMEKIGTKSLNKIDKQNKKVGKSASFMNSKFAKFSIIMSGIAATLFVFQSIIRGLQSIVDQGVEAEKVLMGIKTQLGSVGKEADVMAKLYKLPDDFSKTADAIAAIRKAGYRGQAANDMLPDVVKYNRFLNDYSAAIDVATKDTYKMRDALDSFNSSYDDSMTSALGKTKNMFKEIGSEIAEHFTLPMQLFQKLTRSIERASLKTGELAASSLMVGNTATLPLYAAKQYRDYKNRNKEAKAEAIKDFGPQALIDPKAQESAYQQIFKDIGRIPDRYNVILKKEIDDKIRVLKANVQKSDQHLIDQIKVALENRLADKVTLANRSVITPAQNKRLTDIFNKTGMMHPKLREQRQVERSVEGLSYIESMYPKNVGDESSRLKKMREDKYIQTKFLKDSLEDFIAVNKSKLMVEQEYFDKTKKQSEWLSSYKIELLKREHMVRVSMGMDEARSLELNKDQLDYISNRSESNKMIGGFKQARDDFLKSTSDKFEQFRSLGTSVMSTIEDAIAGVAESGKINFGEMFQAIAADWTRLLIRITTSKLLGNFKGLDWSGGGDGPIHMGATGNTAYGMAGGGVIGEHVKGIGMRTGASYEFGEGGVPEIVLPTNKPVNFSGGGGGQPIINIINNNGSEVTTKEQQTLNGPRTDVIIGNIVASKLLERGSAPNNVMRKAFGASTQLTRR